MTRRKQIKPTANNNNDDSMDVHENEMDVKREPVDGEEDKQEEDVIDAELEAQVSELSSSTNVETRTNGDTKATSDQVSDSVLSPRPNVVSPIGSSASSSALACVLCGVRCENTLQLQQHTINTHTGTGDGANDAARMIQRLLAQQPQLASVLGGAMANTNANAQKFVCTVCGMQHSHETAHRLHVCEHYVVCETVPQCAICNEGTFANAAALLEHQTTRHSALVYRCQHCLQLMPTASAIRQHMQERHSKETIRWKCAACDTAFANREQLQLHMTAVHINQSKDIHPSQNLRNIFTPSAASTSHQGSAKHRSISSTPTSGHKCLICDDRFGSAHYLTQHKLEKHCKVRSGNVCRVCQAIMITVNDFYGHSVEHNSASDPSGNVSCVVCGQTLTTPVELEAHAVYHLQLQSATTPTTDNNNTPSTPNHNSPKPSKCQLCHHTCTTDDQLQLHLLEHAVVNSGLIQCSVCHSNEASVDDLLLHMPTHAENVLPLQCAMCEHRFAFRAQLDHHVLQHNVKEELIKVEGIKTASPMIVAALKPMTVFKPGGTERKKGSTHKPNQTAIGIFTCEHCQKTFASLAALQGHSHVHMIPIRNHRCLHCAKAFTTAAKLRNHQRQHRDGSPFHCDICGKAFSRKDNLKVHYRTHDRNGSEQRSTDGNTPNSTILPTMIKQA